MSEQRIAGFWSANVSWFSLATANAAAKVSNAGGLDSLPIAIFKFGHLRPQGDFGVPNPSKCHNLWHTVERPISPLLGGGLEPAFRVLFSANFDVFPWGFSIRVENYGIEWKENCSQSTHEIFGCVFEIFCLNYGSRRSSHSTGDVKIPV